MKLYRKLSGISFLRKNYAFKFLFVTFIGIHIPLIGILFFVLYGNHGVSANAILVFALVMTLLATGITLYILKNLILPIEMASKVLSDYRMDRTISDLPTEFTDEAGLLMKNIHESIRQNENFINEKQDLMYLLSHDLRTFSGNSQALAKMILEENPPAAIQEYAALIYQSTSQQFHFIESFIRLIKAQDELTQKGISFKNIPLNEAVSAVEEQVAQQLQVKNIRLISEIEVNEANIAIDKELLVRVLVNLIDNAIKFSFRDAVIKIKITDEKDTVCIAVADNGLGFNPAHKEELFQKFTSKNKLGTANEPSNGIGLYLCKKIVEKHHGFIVAESNGINQGAIFSIVFEKKKRF